MNGPRIPQRRLPALLLCTLLTLAGGGALGASDLVITGVVDGPLTGGLPKAVELCVLADVPDLSIYGVGSANNGDGSDGEEFTFPAGPASAGTFLYVASESPGFASFFGFAPQYTDSAANINGDDAIELFMSGGVVDVFGDINVDGTGEPWEHLDGWAYRDDGTGPDGSTFVLANWSFSGPNALDGETTNDTATTPFPIGAYSACELPEPAPDLLLSEIVVTPTGGEFIEIFNPTAANVDLSDVYLTDATFAGGGVFYYNIVTGGSAGGGGFGDFHARFPDGATIAPGEFQTVSLAGSDDFVAEYGFAPTYELFEDGAPDAVPDMREALPGSINGQGGLTNSGEVVVLYTWDGASDLVADIDYAVWGDKAEAVDKTGVSVDGPDGDAVATAYLADTAIGIQDVVAPGSHASGDSFQRVDFLEGAETQSGGNGVTGSDETSEDLSVTWATQAATPGAGPPPPPTVAVVINEIIQNPAAVSDTNGEWFEIFNATSDPVDVNGWTIKDNGSNIHVIAAGGALEIPAGGFLVLGRDANSGANGGVAIDYEYSNIFLGNGSDALILLDTASSEVDRVEWDNGATFPDPNGASMSLKGPALDNNVGANWCEAQTPFGDGDRGTPGAPNDCFAGLVINEVDADDTSGDDEEFLEIYDGGDGNTDLTGLVVVLYNGSDDASYEAFDLDGFSTDGDGFFVICGDAAKVAGCDLDVTPNTNLIQNGADAVALHAGDAADFPNDTPVTTAGLLDALVYDTNDSDDAGLLVLLNAGQPQVNEDGQGDKDLHSNQRCPNGFGGQRNTDGYFQAAPTAGALNNCPPLEIYEIQGSGAASIYDGFVVNTDADVVTAVAPDGFFMQTPAGGTDGDIDTSDGIFVFTGGAPGVVVGDLVDVSGEVQEFFGFTEFGFGSAVTTVGTGSVPAPVAFNATVPTPDPTTPSCAIEFECYEGMLVEVAEGTVTGPNQSFGPDPIAEVFITAVPARTFREPGIEFPFFMPPIPTWDGNPEVFELDPDKLGLPNQIIPAGSGFSAIGVLGFEFGGYELWPSSLVVDPAPLPLAVRAREPGEFTVGTLNMFRLNAAIPKISAYVREVLRSPDILAVQEVQDIVELQAIADQIALDEPTVVYTAYLEEGNDVGGIDVGFLVRDNFMVDAVIQLAADETFIDPTDGSVDILHDRPPLLLEARYLCDCDTSFDDLGDSDSDSDSGGDSGSDSDSDSDSGSPGCEPGPSYEIKVIALHNRSLGGIDDPFDGPRVRKKRYEQAQSVALQVQLLQDADPDVRLVVLGDFNAFEFTDGFVDVTGQIAGDFDPDQNFICLSESCDDLVDPDLTKQVTGLDAAQRYSFIFRGNAQALDQALTSEGLDPLVQGAEFGRGNADAAFDLINVAGTPLRASDHDGLVLYFDSECPRAKKAAAADSLAALGSTGDSKTDKRIAKAIDDIFDSLDSTLWVDGRHLSGNGKKVFSEEKKAVKELLKALDDGVEPEVEEVLTAAIAALVSADEILARVALDGAFAVLADAGCFASGASEACMEAAEELAKGEEKFAQALAEIAEGDFDKAIERFKQAWEKAGKAVEELEGD